MKGECLMFELVNKSLKDVNKAMCDWCFHCDNFEDGDECTTCDGFWDPCSKNDVG
jgi:recombinational DNA repair protein RecR